MKIQNIMTTNVASCSPDTNLAAAAGLLWDYDCGSLPVVDRERKVVGVITDRDLCMAAATKNRLASEITVRETSSANTASSGRARRSSRRSEERALESKGRGSFRKAGNVAAHETRPGRTRVAPARPIAS